MIGGLILGYGMWKGLVGERFSQGTPSVRADPNPLHSFKLIGNNPPEPKAKENILTNLKTNQLHKSRT